MTLNIKQERLLEALSIQSEIGKEHDVDKLLPLIINKISQLLNADRATLFHFDERKMLLQTKIAEGLDDKTISINMDMGIAGASVLLNQSINQANAYDSQYFNDLYDKKTDYNTESIIAVPINNLKGEVIGVLQFLNHKHGRFTQHDEEYIKCKLASITPYLSDTDKSPKNIIEQKIDELVQYLGADRGTLFKLDPDANHLISIYGTGLDEGPVILNLGLGIVGHVAVTHEMIVINDAKNDPRFDSSTDKKTGYITNNLVALPLLDSKGDLIGIIEVINKIDGDLFNESDINLLTLISRSISITLENTLLLKEHDIQFKSLLEVLASSIDAKDHLTSGHSNKVREYSLAIGKEMGFSDEDLDVLGTAALLHDYGKIGVDDNILKKNGKLNNEEFGHIKTHVDWTRKILSQIHFSRKYRRVPLIAASHHEYLDGTGYSSGLKGYEVPFMSRILTVADVYEALTSERHYRKAMSKESAFEILDEGAGTKFDPVIIASFKRILL